MTKKKSTRSALLTSVIALLLCFTMLLGTTFAWFTDSVASGGNIIKSGSLEVGLYYADGTKAVPADDSTDWMDASKGAIYTADQIWEPGYTDAKHLKISNNGTLALKYQLAIVPNGTVSELADVIDVYFISEAVQATREMLEAATPIGTLRDMINDPDGAAYGYLLPKGSTATEGTLEVVGSQTVTIALKMREDVGNEYQDKGIGTDFSIRLLATQYTYENDSFDKQYDKDATYPPVPDKWDGNADTSWYNETDTEFILTSAEQVAGLAVLVDAGTDTFEGKTIKLSSDLDLYVEDENGNPISFEPIGSYRYNTTFNGTFDGQDHTIFNMYQNGWDLDNEYYLSDLGLGLFGKTQDATIKNLNIDGADQPSEFNLIGTVAGAAYGECVFENITVSNSYMGNHSYYSGGIVGWASGDHKYINCDVEASTVISSQWGDFNNANGGLIGGAGSSGTYYFEDCDVACVIDAFNDVTSAYEWYAYRNVGMLIGNTGHTEVNDEGTTIAAAPNVTCVNVTVTYGEWANYHYCQFNAMNYPWVRVEAGNSTHAYGNARYDYATDANGNNVVDENHVHNEGEGHNVLLVFDQLFGGSQGGVYGNPEHEGVTVIYNNK